MRTKTFLFHLFIFTYLPLASLFSLTDTKNEKKLQDDYAHALASLSFFLHEHKKIIDDSSYIPPISFSKANIKDLWERVRIGVSRSNNDEYHTLYQRAVSLYKQSLEKIRIKTKKEARQYASDSSKALNKLRDEVFNEEIKLPLTKARNNQRKDPNVTNNLHLQKRQKEAMRPYLLPLNHPTRNTLDSIFLRERATLNKDTFFNAGFRVIAKRPRSYIIVAKHRDLPGYLVKAYLDTELKKKFKKDSWEWLVKRCEGAKKINAIIKQRRCRYFTVAKKWIYCLPEEPSPPSDDPLYTRHLALLLVTDMRLTSAREGIQAWRTVITKEHLSELFGILVRAKGSSYRPDNIAYTEDGTFAFIDTEYPSLGPDLKSIRNFLSEEMLSFWDELIKNGGVPS